MSDRKEYHKDYMQKRRKKFEKMGICPCCGKRKKMFGYSTCKRCYDYQLAYRLKKNGDIEKC